METEKYIYTTKMPQAYKSAVSEKWLCHWYKGSKFILEEYETKEEAEKRKKELWSSLKWYCETCEETFNICSKSSHEKTNKHLGYYGFRCEWCNRSMSENNRSRHVCKSKDIR